MPQSRLIYFADPMCSWCWGFSPVMSRIVNQYGDRLPLTLVMGGLRAGNTRPMDETMKREIRGHWQHVEKLTGQDFDYGFFERDGFVYDTAPACRAVVTARTMAPGQEIGMLERLHRAFYLRGRDLTSGPVLLQLAVESGFDEARFADAFQAEETSLELARDFELTGATGVRSFPTLLGGDDEDGYGVLTVGFRPFEELQAGLDGLAGLS